MLAGISEGTWAFLGVLLTNAVILVGLFWRQGKQSRSVEQINRAVNHQADDAPTLIQRVVTVEGQIEDLAEAQVQHRKWQERVYTALAHHVGMALPQHDGADEYHRVHD